MNISYQMTSYSNIKMKYLENLYIGSGANKNNLNNLKMKFM